MLKYQEDYDESTGEVMDKYREELIDTIVRNEWSQFDKVNNEGGRASCQDDWKTFNIMRRAQYLNWPDELLDSYLEDLLTAEREERNLLAEKYGRMMHSTAPAEYERIRHLFPERSEERLGQQEEIIAIQIRMDDEFCRQYPVYSSGGRRTHTSEDTAYSTSKETYIRGEMGTWSDRTFMLYSEWIRKLEEEGENLSEMTAENIVRQYGYSSLAEAESWLGR